MGTSTDGILAYGVDLPEYEGCDYSDLPWAEDGDDEFGDTIARLAGGRQYPEEGWLDDKRKAAEACGLELVFHCSYDYPMYILAVRGTEHTASRGYPTEIKELPTPDATKLREWCKKYEIECDPKWLLCSLWG